MTANYIIEPSSSNKILINNSQRSRKQNIRYIVTNKLFYKKWIYRVKCTNLFLNNSHNAFLDWMNKFYFLPEIQVRYEGFFIFLYFNDESLLEHIKDEYEWIFECSIPENVESTKILLNTNKSIKLCNRYYRGEYRYKIYINSQTSFEIKKKFKEWIVQYGDKFYIPKKSIEWLDSNGRWITDAPYFYVKDSNTVFLSRFMLGNNIKNVEEYILKSLINNKNNENLEDVSL